MIEKLHPWHRRLFNYILAVTALLTAITFMLAFHFSKKCISCGESAETQLTIFVCLFFGLIFFTSLIARAYFCICPSCKKLLFKQVDVDTDNEPRKFVCEKCSTVWNSQIILVFGGN